MLERLKRAATGRTGLAIGACLLIAGIALALLLDGGDGGRPAAGESVAPVPVEPGEGIGDGAGPPPGADRSAKDTGDGKAEEPPPDPGALAVRRAQRAYRAYVDAIDARDGEALCGRLIRPGFERQLRPPVERSGCASSIRASIGFADPRGFPVWEGTTLSGFESGDAGASGRVTLVASIVTTFRDREQPSVESDVAYLEPQRDGGGSYRLVKASGALWRAVGKPDVPFGVIEPPPGF